jgi:hypothetical protein
MDEPNVVLKAIKIATVNALSEKLKTAMDAAHITVANQSMNMPDPEKSLGIQNKAIVTRFAAKLNHYYDVLNGEQSKPINVLSYANLSLVGEEDLEALIALEGMISHSRNSDISEYLRFTTRLDSVLLGAVIDESNNPMDPEQIGEAFKDAISPLGLPAKELLTAYRSFNNKVFHELEPILEMANTIFIEHDILPNLDLAARRRKEQSNQRAVARERSVPEERAFNPPADSNQTVSNPQLFSMMQSLMHGLARQPNHSAVAPNGQPSRGNPANPESTGIPSGYVSISGELIVQSPANQSATQTKPEAGMVIGGKRIEIIEQDKLFALLQELNSTLSASAKGNEKPVDAGNAALVDINKSLGELLEQKSGRDKLQAIDTQSADVISLITMLYEVIWADETVPIPVKELIGRTQIKVLSIALKDATFFDSAEHPARRLINELATAGISWTESEKLDKDPVYKKMQDVVSRFIKGDCIDQAKLTVLLEEFMQFKSDQSEAELALEKRLVDASEREQRVDEIAQYARQKIAERILDKNTPTAVVDFLQTQFHKFVTEVLLREGPGGASWRPVMNTIDVLLWTVQAERNEGDIERFIKVNPRLLLNLGKALTIAGINQDERERALLQLKQVQEDSFKGLAQQRNAAAETGAVAAESQSPALPVRSNLAPDDEHLLEVAKYNIGIWLEFKTQGGRSIRCTLAAKIATIDKYVFINSHGVKVIEKSKMGLAKELKAGSVRVISEAPLIERAMETVIGNLRDNKASSGVEA